MTVKEVEALSGMARANIRFYEQEGLLSPEREANGYRNYSPDDLQTLLRIRLLRGLGLSIEELRELQNGRLELSEALESRLERLERELLERRGAAELCRAMLDDRASYLSLDADKYLNADFGAPPVRQADAVSYADCIWRRYFARALDLSIYGFAWTAFLVLALGVNVTARNGFLRYIDGLAAMALMIFIEPLLLRFFGATPGKLIFGLRIENAAGGRLSYREGLERTFGVFRYGYGLNIPIYNIVRLIKCARRCDEGELMPWDEGVVYTVHRDERCWRGLVYVLSECVLFFALTAVMLSGMFPRHRGNLTVAEFADNFNYLAEYYGFDFDGVLNENGEWDAPPDDSGYVISIDFDRAETPRPDFEYTLENGYLTAVGFSYSQTDSPNGVAPCSAQMWLASLAFVGAQRGAGVFSGSPKELNELIISYSFDSLERTLHGVKISWDTRYTGFKNEYAPYGVLRPMEDVANEYELDFSLTKLG